MSAFDITLTAAPPQLSVPDNEDDPINVIELIVPVLIGIPAAQGVAALPIGTVRVPVERDHAIKLGKRMAEEAEKLPKSSKIEVASSLANVEAAAEQMNRFS